MVKGGYYKKAINEYNKIIEINPESRLHRLFFASFLIRIGHYDKAEQHFEAALTKHKYILSLNTRMKLNYTSLLCRNKKREKAQEVFETLDKSDRQSLYKYMALVLELKHKDAHALIQKYKKIHTHTLATSHKIEELIKRNAHSLCIVGNGAVCKGKKKENVSTLKTLLFVLITLILIQNFKKIMALKRLFGFERLGIARFAPKKSKALKELFTQHLAISITNAGLHGILYKDTSNKTHM